MKASRFAVAALSFAAVAAYADDADLSGQFANTIAGSQSRAQVQAQLTEYRQAGVNPWSTSYNPLKSFQGQRSRAEVQAEYLASRDAVAAMTREDSGSAYIATRRSTPEVRHLAGTPANAQ